jgi:hypothetical protein
VLFSTKIFGEKSYPSVDGAFPFPASRFGWQRNAMDELGLATDLVHDVDSDTETSDDDYWDDAEIGLHDPVVRIPGGRLGVSALRLALRRGIGDVQIAQLVRGAIRVNLDGFAEETDSEEEEPEQIQVAVEGINIQMTPEEEAAVRRLHTMVPGFDVNTVVQVYFACEKNEAATHQCLLWMV